MGGYNYCYNCYLLTYSSKPHNSYLVANYPRLVFVGYNPSDLHGIFVGSSSTEITGVN